MDQSGGGRSDRRSVGVTSVPAARVGPGDLWAVFRGDGAHSWRLRRVLLGLPFHGHSLRGERLWLFSLDLFGVGGGVGGGGGSAWGVDFVSVFLSLDISLFCQN